jgi:putative tricarboxylic transport membrane protein
VGAYSLRNGLFDVWVMIASGVAGFFLEARRVPLAPLILGLILGPMLEENLRAGLIKTGGDLVPFFTRPICFTLVLLLAAAFAGPWLARRFRNRTGSTKPADSRA